MYPVEPVLHAVVVSQWTSGGEGMRVSQEDLHEDFRSHCSLSWKSSDLGIGQMRSGLIPLFCLKAHFVCLALLPMLTNLDFSLHVL